MSNKTVFTLLINAAFGDGPNTVSESIFSNAELSEVFGPYRVRERTQ